MVSKVVNVWKIGKYTTLELDEGTPMQPYHKYCIDGREYDIVPVYDMPNHIAVEAEGDFLGKTVEFIY